MSSTAPPNVLFLLSDEHSYRFMSDHHDAAMAEPCHTPTLDSLKQSGSAFNTTYCQMPLCTPSRMCMLSGKEVQNCGAWENGSVLDPDLPTLPKSFAKAGYTTALVGKMHFGGNLQFHGFQHRPYGDVTGNAGHQEDLETAESLKHVDATPIQKRTLHVGDLMMPESQLQEQIVVRETISFLREQTAANPEKPWFCCASFSRPHFPLHAPKRHMKKYWPKGVTEPKVRRTGDSFDHPMTQGMRKGFDADRIEGDELAKARAAYFACVDYLDEILGDLLVTLEKDGLLDNTIIVYTSDHGEMAGEHGVWWKNSWHEASSRVPLIVQTPTQRKQQDKPHQVNTPVSLADLFPTLCGLAGIDCPDGLDGMDLSHAVTTGQEPDRGYIHCDVLYDRWGKGTSFRMVRDGQYKYIAFGEAPELLFDLDADPFEQHNLARSATGEVAQVLEKLRQHVKQTIDLTDATQWRKKHLEMREQHPMPANIGTLNGYILADGRVIDAGVTVGQPKVVTHSIHEMVADAPK